MLIALVAVVLGLLPGFAWLTFYLAEDPHPEPKRLVLFTFLAGMVFGLFAVLIEYFSIAGAPLFGMGELSIGFLVELALIEELVKLAAAYFSIGRTPVLRDPVDPMVYMIIAALGFATFENIGTLVNLTSAGHITIETFQTISFRFVGATLLHSLTSGIVGYEWSAGLAKKRVGAFLAVGVILATLTHAIFNYLVMHAVSIALPVLFLLLVGFFVLSDFEKLRTRELK